MLRLLVGIVVAAALLLWGSEDAARDELIVRGVLAGVVVVTFPLTFFVHFFREPSERERSLKAQIDGFRRKQSDAEMLRSLANDVSQFVDSFIVGRPGGERDLSFVGRHQRDNPKIRAEKDSAILVGGDDDMAQMMILKQDERRRYDQGKISEFVRRYAGRISEAASLIGERQGALTFRQKRTFARVRSLLSETEYYYFERSVFDQLVTELAAAAEKLDNDRPQKS